MAKMSLCTLSFRTHLPYAPFEEATKRQPFGIASVPFFPHKTFDLKSGEYSGRKKISTPAAEQSSLSFHSP
jgi:hypothetical protein